MRTSAVYLIAGLALIGATSSGADTLLVDDVAASQATAAERPGRGLRMTTVESRWGAPAARVAAVGQPPISRWEYPGFIVYFEYDHVVHAVARR